jgi:hypothetical protein
MAEPWYHVSPFVSATSAIGPNILNNKDGISNICQLLDQVTILDLR